MKKIVKLVFIFILFLTAVSCERNDSVDYQMDLNGHEAVDLGLPSGLLWATCNVGANSPADYGYYFAWGETAPKDYYAWETYKYGIYNSDNDDVTLTKYTLNDGKTTLESMDAATTIYFGGTWRMPTQVEQDELLTQCTWVWTTFNGVNGYRVVGKNGNSIFLPAAGSYHQSRLGNEGKYGNYWSASLYCVTMPGYDLTSAVTIGFAANKPYRSFSQRRFGFSIRPVCSSQ